MLNAKTKNIEWFESPSFTAVRVKEPEAGDWQLKNNTDEGNRVFIASNIALEIDPLPSKLELYETFPLRSRVESEEGKVKREDVLSKMSLKASLNDENIAEGPWEPPTRKRFLSVA